MMMSERSRRWENAPGRNRSEPPQPSGVRGTVADEARREGLCANYSVAELVKWVGICAGLGETSRNTWLKIPYVPGFEQVVLATTLPILLLGGPAHGDPLPTLKECAAGIACGNNVRGTMVGRNVLFPGDDDPLSMTAAVAAVIRYGTGPEDAVLAMDQARNTSMDALARYL